MSFKIKIIDNDDGAVLYDDDDVKAIVGAYSTGDTVNAVLCTSCNTTEYAGAIYGALKIADIARKKNPTVGLVVAMAEMNQENIQSVEIDMSEIRKHKNGD